MPLVLDNLGLDEALNDLVELSDRAADSDVALALHRIA